MVMDYIHGRILTDYNIGQTLRDMLFNDEHEFNRASKAMAELMGNLKAVSGLKDSSLPQVGHAIIAKENDKWVIYLPYDYD